MVETHAFEGKVLCTAQMQLGEGPSYDRETDTAWWFNILGKELHELQLSTGEKRVHALPRMASVLARIDADRQLMVMDDGIYIRNRADGALSLHVALEADKPGNRCNDGRVHASGALWIGTMGRKAEKGAGTIYHVAAGKVTPLFPSLSIPNAICFSPDGAAAYFVDTDVNHLMQVTLDPATGLPLGKPELLVDGSGEEGGMDGAVCDAKGRIWNARWGAGRVDCYDPTGRLLSRHALPASQTSCPAFIGPNLDRLLVTSAYEGLDPAENPLDGATFELGITVEGREEPSYRL